MNNEQLDDIQECAEKQSAAHTKMIDLDGGIGLLGVAHPDMFEDMQEWDDISENEHADTVLAILALVREQQAKIERVEKLLDEKYKLWAAICGNTCSKDIVGVDHDAIADEVATAIRAAITATRES